MYRRLTVIAGRTMEVRKYHSYKAPGIGLKRNSRKNPTKESAKKGNDRRAEDALRWMMNTVFRDGDLSITLTYKENPPHRIQDLKKDAQDFVKRLRTEYRKRDTPMWYVYALGAGPHRRHIHITVKDAGLSPSELKEIWGKGRVQITPLYSEGQYRELAAYYMKNGADTRAQQIEQGDKPGRFYYAAHGMPKPEITKETISAPTFRKAIYMRAHAKKGYRLEKGSERYFINTDGYEQYEYTLIKDTEDEDRDIHDNRQGEPPKVGMRKNSLQHGVRAP